MNLNVPSETQTTETSSEFTCSVCCETVKSVRRKQNQQIICPKCQMTVCRQCQFRFERDQCMNCEETFTREFVLNNLGNTFLKEVVKPRVIRELMEAEEQLLPGTQTMVNRQREERLVKRNLRFGLLPATEPLESISIPNETSKKVVTFRSFPCPKDTCRGFIEDTWTCGLCRTSVCPQCHVELPIVKSEHQCRKEDLETLIALERETKPCPRCRVAIYKIEGCNDMYCTHCCTHFCWRTGKVLRRSTNGHYLNLARYAENVATIEGNEETTGVQSDENFLSESRYPCQLYHFHLDRPSVTSAMLEFTPSGDPISASLKRALFTDSEAIRTLFRLRYQRETILQKSANTLEGLRVKYLEGELEYQVWSNRVYLDFRKREQSLQVSETLQLYLSTISYLQNQLVLGRLTPAETMSSLIGLVELCNLSLRGIQTEYGGKTLEIRNPKSEGPAPSFL